MNINMTDEVVAFPTTYLNILCPSAREIFGLLNQE